MVQLTLPYVIHMVKLIVPYVTFCHFLYHMLTYGTKKSCIWSVLVPSVLNRLFLCIMPYILAETFKFAKYNCLHSSELANTAKKAIKFSLNEPSVVVYTHI